MKLLFLASRSDELVAEDEFGSVLRHGGLHAHQVDRIRMEQAEFWPLSLQQYDGVILGGSPFTVSDTAKSPTQIRVETSLRQVVKALATTQTPFLGLCYGIGVVTTALGGKIGTRFGENTSAVTIRVTKEGEADPILADMPAEFSAYVGHKEACEELPPGADLLATSDFCAVQLYRFGAGQYVTQFHPEMDAESVVGRIDAYPNSGYFGINEIETVKQRIRAADTATSHRILVNFVSICRQYHQQRIVPAAKSTPITAPTQ